MGGFWFTALPLAFCLIICFFFFFFNALVGFKGNRSPLEMCCIFSRGLNQMEDPDGFLALQGSVGGDLREGSPGYACPFDPGHGPSFCGGLFLAEEKKATGAE